MIKINSVIFATFSIRQDGQRTATNGMIEPLSGFFVPRFKRFTLLEQPHPGSDAVIPFLEDYKNRQLAKKSQFFFSSLLLYPLLKLSNSNKTQVFFKIRDFFSIFEYFIKDQQKYDLFIGLESINALAGIILKKIGVIKRVVYYVSDYSPNRYKPVWFNNLYLSLDRFAATHADFVWDVSKAMMPARINAGFNSNRVAPVIHVPNALYPKQINYLPFSKLFPHSLLYVGTLGRINGPDIAIKALKIVIQLLPDATLHIYGDGEPDISRLKKLTTTLKLGSSIIFHGFVSDQVKLSKESKKYAIALAPYLEVPGSPRWWADATKIRLYMASGLPTITTRVPPLGKEIETDGAGIITNDTPQDTARAILALFKDKELYSRMKRNAIKRAKNNTWENTYLEALKKMGL